MKKFLVCLSFLWTSTAAHAHAGPPFPILVDQKAGPYVASVWNDPDVGTGTFFVVLEPNLPGTRVRIGLQPVTGRLPEAFYPTEAQPMPDGVRYFTLAPLDKEEMWRVRVFLEGPRGGGEALRRGGGDAGRRARAVGVADLRGAVPGGGAALAEGGDAPAIVHLSVRPDLKVRTDD